MSDAEVSIERKIDQLLRSVASLDRTVRGDLTEGNSGILGKIEREIEAAQAVHNDHDQRIEKVERAVLTMQAKVAGAAAVGTGIGTLVSVLMLNNGGGGI